MHLPLHSLRLSKKTLIHRNALELGVANSHPVDLGLAVGARSLGEVIGIVSDVSALCNSYTGYLSVKCRQKVRVSK